MLLLAKITMLQEEHILFMNKAALFESIKILVMEKQKIYLCKKAAYNGRSNAKETVYGG